MKIITAIVLIAAFFISCNNAGNKGLFTITGELKNATDQKVYLEEIFIGEKKPVVLDTAEIKNGHFVLSATAAEEGLYRIRTEKGDNGYLIINDNPNIKLTADMADADMAKHSFSSSASSSLQKLIVNSDSIQQLIGNKYNLLMEFKKMNIIESDSIYTAITNEFSNLKETLTQFCFKYADTSKSPMVSLLAATMAPVELGKFEMPFSKLLNRFPKHNGIAGALAFIKSKAAPQNNQPVQPATSGIIGSFAPELTMNDVNDKPFSLSSLRGKYVLVDFWASWCGPCRGENPNLVAAFNQFKNKNFTILGVSLDENKAAWIKAIEKDELSWQHISDLKGWGTAAIGLYKFDGIPYNVLVDPEGKIIADNLRGPELISKLEALVK